VSKVLRTFVLPISCKFFGGQKKTYCQIEAEILKFIWVSEKGQFRPKKRHCNINICQISVFHLSAKCKIIGSPLREEQRQILLNMTDMVRDMSLNMSVMSSMLRR
jgi:hypothetical protein